jgi:hypothetical protein
MNRKAICIPINLLIILFLIVAISATHTTSRAAIQSWSLYLPLIARPNCATDVMINGDFEQDDYGWVLYSTGQGNKVHDLIGSVSEGFSPYRGAYAARLGGYEGVWDGITQAITIPSQGRLTYWWKMGTYETLPHHDHFVVTLLQPDGTAVANLAFHDDQDIEGIWQQDIVDLSAYAGGNYQIQLFVYNDNWYFTWFDIDEIHLCGSE